MLKVLCDRDFLLVVGGERAGGRVLDDGGGVCDGLDETLTATRVVRGPADELVVEVVWPEDGHLHEEQLTLDAARVGVVENGPNWDLKGVI